MKPYADSNFFPRLYLELDAGSLEASLLAEPVVTGQLEPLPITRLHWLEVLNAQGIFVEQISIRPNSDATLAVDATLRARTK